MPEYEDTQQDREKIIGSVRLSDVSEIGGFNAVGEYVARLSRMDPTTSRKGDPMLNAYFEILEGKHEGEEIRLQFWLGASKDKKSGRVWAPGVAEIRAACAAVKVPLGDIEFKLDAVAAGRIFGTAVHNKRIRIKVMPDPDRKDGDGNKVEGRFVDGKWQGPTQNKILGLAGTSSAPVGGDAPPGQPMPNPLQGIV